MFFAHRTPKITSQYSLRIVYSAQISMLCSRKLRYIDFHCEVLFYLVIILLFCTVFFLTCGITDMFCLRSCKPSVVISIPSMRITPTGSTRRSSDTMMLLFPAPVRPTMPIWIVSPNQIFYCIPLLSGYNVFRCLAQMHVLQEQTLTMR